MSNSIADILGGRAKSDEPPEFQVIKRYMMKHFKVVPKLSIGTKKIIIGVPNSAVAGALRMSLHELQEACQTENKLIIRIGG